MSFFINLTNGNQLATVVDGTVNTSSAPITLIGKNFPTYGEILNQNLVSMLENFANATAPTYALTGQLWYDSLNNTLKYYRGGGTAPYFQNLANIIFSDTTPTNPQLYDLWWDGVNQQLKMFDENFITIGPQTTNDGLYRVSGTNSFILQIGGNNLFTIDANGRVNAPSNPIAQGTGMWGLSGSSNTINSPFVGSGLTVNPFRMRPAVITINQGGYLQESTGVFTCPVSGIYEVHATAISLGYSPETTQQIMWQKNSSDTGISARAKNISIGTNAAEIPMTASGFIQCAAGDTISLVMNAETNGVIDNKNSSMSIRLVQ
jgi:hypothetical protein